MDPTVPVGEIRYLAQAGLSTQRVPACQVTQSCLTLCDPMNCSPPDPSVHGDSLGKNTGVGCYTLLQEIFPTQELNPCLLCLLHWQAGFLSFFRFFFFFLPLVPPGKPQLRERSVQTPLPLTSCVTSQATPSLFASVSPIALTIEAVMIQTH